jgi:hypothetical protein
MDLSLRACECHAAFARAHEDSDAGKRGHRTGIIAMGAILAPA